MKAEICPKCSKYESCKIPCYPVKQFLAEDNLSVFEKTFTKETGEKVSIIFARSREDQRSMLSIGEDKRGDPCISNKEQQTFSTENESPFSIFKPTLKQTGLFIDKFFHNFSYADLAVKYDMSKSNAIKTYHNAVNRVLAVLEAMDTGEVATKQVEYWKQKVKERSGDLPKGQKWYLLNKLFGLRPSEIAEMEGMDKKSSSVRQLIIRVGMHAYRRLRACTSGVCLYPGPLKTTLRTGKNIYFNAARISTARPGFNKLIIFRSGDYLVVQGGNGTY